MTSLHALTKWRWGLGIPEYPITTTYTNYILKAQAYCSACLVNYPDRHGGPQYRSVDAPRAIENDDSARTDARARF